ncbi:MAG: hydrogenase expression/formation protein HypE [Desulfomonilaceae bacterium]
MTPRSNGKSISLAHGGGGKMSGRLIRDLVLPRLNRGKLAALADSVVLSDFGDKIAFTTDSFVVAPIFFPGGDIGSLSVHGTCNDLACSGARPTFLSVGLILEEGFPMDDLTRILDSMSSAADTCGVEIVTGDTKVTPKGATDRIFINTAGIGKVVSSVELTPSRIEPGDIIIVSGQVGDHGMAVMLSRAEFSFDFDVKSDSAGVWPIVERLLKLGGALKFLRDPTRGGLSATLNEIATMTNLTVSVDETLIPVSPQVSAAAEILGINPLEAANEGKIVAVIDGRYAAQAFDMLKDCPQASQACAIGTMTSETKPRVVIKTRIGGSRILAEPSGELLPRIC